MIAGGTPGVDRPAVEAWFARHVAFAKPPLRFEVISGGHSNITYLVCDGDGRRLVLRRPPIGDLPARAHDVAREHRILAALGPTAVPVPEVLALCTDASVTGAPFYVMEWVEGRVVAEPRNVDEALPDTGTRRCVAERLVDVLAELHHLDVDAVGLGHLARRDGYIERQLTRLHAVWQQTMTRELPLIDDLLARLRARAPEQRYTGIVHSDYRLGNTIVTGDGDVAAVLDWELCTLGDVLADVGFLLDNWDGPGDPSRAVWMATPPTVAGGFPGRDELLERYAVRSGFDVTNVDYYRAFAYWRVAVIAEGINRRYRSAAMAFDAADLDQLDRRVGRLAELADEHLRRVER